MSSVGIFERLKQSKDPCVLQELRKFLRYSTKLAEANTRCQFLIHCIEQNQFPRYYWKILRRSRINPTATALSRHANNERDTLLDGIRELERKKAQYEVALDKLSLDERTEFEEYTLLIAAKRADTRSEKLRSQLNPLSPSSKFPSNPERYVHNLSSITLDKTLLEVLSLGPKFCVPRRRATQLELEVQFENLYDQLSDLNPLSETSVEQLKATLVSACYQYLNYKPRTKHLLTRDHLEALKNLQANQDILLSKPDKGAGIVLMDRSDYIVKMNTILADQTKFRKMTKEKDKTHIIEKSISKTLKFMKQSGYIDTNTFTRLQPKGSTIPRLYGLPKVHKPNVPLRPILDMSNSPYHSLAKWLTEILEPIRRELAVYSLKDSFQFVELIQHLQLTEHKMFSLDVESLFTNVPLKETVNYLCDYIDRTGKDVGLPTTLLKKLILLCTENVQFMFNKDIYRQKDGVAMGSPIGPLLADIFMSKLENDPLLQTIRQFSCYCRYVDDIFVIGDQGLDFTTLLNKFNTAHPSIKFSLETETNNCLNFLDVNITWRDNRTLRRAIFRKPTWTGQYIHFDSFIPLKTKRNLIKSLTARTTRICSNDTIEQELEHLKQVFIQNGYPLRFITTNMDKAKHQMSLSLAPKKKVYLNLPYKGESLSDLITRKLANAVENCFPAASLCLSFSSTGLINWNLKDKLPKSTASFCVYHFVCSCGASYVGRTTRRLSDRIREHCPPSLARGGRTSNSSSIAEHLMETGHTINGTTDFQVLYRVIPNRSQPIRFRLLSIAEAIGIRLFKPELCVHKKFVKTLNLCWPSPHAVTSGGSS